MEELTRPQAYYDFFEKKHYKRFRQGMVAGIAVAAAGLLLRLLPPLYAGLRALGGFAAFMSGAGWLILVLLGVGVAVLLWRIPLRLRALTLFHNGIAVAGRGGKRSYPFSEVESVTDCRVGSRRVATIQVRGQSSLRWNDSQLRDYKRCMAEMEALRAQYLLGSAFPENLGALEVKLSVQVQLADGVLYYNEMPLTPQTYTASHYEDLVPGKPDIVIDCEDGRRVALFPETVGCRTALLQVLEALLPRPDDASVMTQAPDGEPAV